MWETKNIVTILILVVLLVLVASFNSLNDITGLVTKTGQLQIGNAIPDVVNIYLNEQLSSDTPGDVIIDPTANGTKNISVKVTISDNNGDCNTFTSNNVTVYLCNGTNPCNSSTADHTVYLNYNSTDGQWGASNEYCNMSGSDGEFLFFEINGTWRVNVTVTDGINTSTPLAKNWTYNGLSSFDYAAGGNIQMGFVNLEQWNNGTGQKGMRNSGNIVLDLDWNATNFSGNVYSQNITLDGTNYVIDDDALSPDDTDNMAQKFINESHENKVSFVQDSGLLTCNSTACVNENSTFDVYWHIDIPGGLPADTYENTIEVESSYH